MRLFGNLDHRFIFVTLEENQGRAWRPTHGPPLIWSAPMKCALKTRPTSSHTGSVFAAVCSLVWLTLAATTVGCALGPKARGPEAARGSAPQTFVYVGTSAGTIETLSVDAVSGGLTARTRTNTGGVPAVLTSLPFGKLLIALDDKAASVAAFAVEPSTGALQLTGRTATGGSKPGRTTVDRSGKFVLVTNQASASVAVSAAGPGGRLSPPDLFPAGAGAFGVTLHPSNTVAFVANTKAGTVSQLSFNEGTGTLTPKPGAAIGMPWGSGPRLVIAHPNGRWVYVLNETNNTISVHAFDDRMGTVSRLAFQVIATAAADPAAASRARAREMVVATSGQFVYVLDAGQDSIATFAIEAETGALSLIDSEPSGGTGAVALALDPGGQHLVVAHQGSRHLAVFRLDAKTGIPSLTDSTRIGSAPLSLTVLRMQP